jgi:hypothetical protein
MIKSFPTTSSPPGQGWDDLFAKLAGYRSLIDGWNGDTAAAPAPISHFHGAVFCRISSANSPSSLLFRSDTAQ